MVLETKIIQTHDLTPQVLLITIIAVQDHHQTVITVAEDHQAVEVLVEEQGRLAEAEDNLSSK